MTEINSIKILIDWQHKIIIILVNSKSNELVWAAKATTQTIEVKEAHDKL